MIQERSRLNRKRLNMDATKNSVRKCTKAAEREKLEAHLQGQVAEFEQQVCVIMF